MSAYLNARVSIFSGRLWQPGEFERFIKTPDAEIGDLLARHGLSQLAKGYETPDPVSLVLRVITGWLEETQVLIRPLNGAERRFLSYWTERFEISNVKTLLRGKMTGERPAALIARLIPMGAFGRLDVHDLAHAEDTSELLRRLGAGPYAGIVRHARRAFEESHDPFILDAALDRGYYEGLAHRAQLVENTAGASFRRLMGQVIDRINLVWLLRYRFNYNLPPAQVYFLLVSSHYSLSASRLRGLAALGSVEAIVEALPETLRAVLRGATDLPTVSARLENLAAQTATEVLHSGAPAIARAFAYLILRERDLRAVRAVLRGRQLGLPLADIETAIYLPTEGNA